MNLQKLNDEISTLVSEHEKNHRIALESAGKVGLRLIDAKKQIPYGEWNKWANENCPLSKTTRNNYMTLARYWLATGEYPASSSLSTAIRILSASEEVKQIVKERENEGITVTENEIKRLIAKIPTAKRISKRVHSLRKIIVDGAGSQEIEYKQWLEIRDEVSDALEEINHVLVDLKKKDAA